MIVTVGVFLVALLYSSVGHAGASGYIAVMSVCNLTPEVIKPTALVLNVLVATLATVQFWRAGHFSWGLFWPFALLSVPAAFVWGYLHLPPSIFKPLVGVILLFSAVRLCFRRSDPAEVSPPTKVTALGVGAGIGLLSGLTGTGGGIFLTPLLLFRRWARTKPAAAISALFILLNSIAGLAGHLSSGQPVPAMAGVLALAAVVGGTIGSHLGSRKFPVRTVSLLLSAVLIIAGTKLLFTR